MRDRERESSVEVETGLHLVQYLSSAEAPDGGPVVQVSLSSKAGARAQIIGDPRLPPGELPGPGSALVVRAEGPSTLRIVVRPRLAGGSTDARVEVRALGRGETRQPRAAPARAATEPALLRVLGHVARRGDVWADSGEWIGGPSSPLPVEGFEIHVPASANAPVIEYQGLAGKRQPRWSPWTRAPNFVGTRGRATPLLGLRFRVSNGHRLRAEALFLGAAVAARSGAEVELVGPTSREPLLGFSLSVDGAASARPVQATAPVPQERAARVRVFRATSS